MADKKKDESLVLWDQQLAADAAEAAAEVASLGGAQFFSLRGGKLALGDARMPDNEVSAIVVASVFENVLYRGDFDPDSPASPECYAFGAKQDDMRPHAAVAKPAHGDCKSCPNNQFGTADKGRGKACKNRVRLALLPAGVRDAGRLEMFESDVLKTQSVAYLNVPPTSTGAWGAYVKALVATLKRAPYGVVTRIRLVPDEKTQIRLEFACEGSCSGDLAEVILAKRAEAQAAIVQAYPEHEAAPAKPSKKRRF